MLTHLCGNAAKLDGMDLTELINAMNTHDLEPC